MNLGEIARTKSELRDHVNSSKEIEKHRGKIFGRLQSTETTLSTFEVDNSERLLKCFENLDIVYEKI